MKQIPISHEKPPVYDELVSKFGADWDKGVIIAYDSKIHCKNKDVPPPKIIHESVHISEQEKLGNEAWWRLYFESPIFRFEQELLAYTKEAQFLKKYIKNREIYSPMIRELARSFSSPLYGTIVTYEQAYKLLK